MNKRVLVMGGTGMLGHKLHQCFRTRFDTKTTVRGNGSASDCISGADANNFDSVLRAVVETHPDVIVNCIGIIKQSEASQDYIASLTVNSLFPHRLAALCCAAGIRLIHISTDCVFSGGMGMYVESDVSDAADIYGRTKYLGEVAAPGCLTLRTSIIGRELDSSNGLLEWFLKNHNRCVRGFTRAIYSGLTTRALAFIIADVIENHPLLNGLYHVSAKPISKYDLLRIVNIIYDCGSRIEQDDTLVCNRSLDSSRFSQNTGFMPSSWTKMIEDMRDDPAPYKDWRVP